MHRTMKNQYIRISDGQQGGCPFGAVTLLQIHFACICTIRGQNLCPVLNTGFLTHGSATQNHSPIWTMPYHNYLSGIVLVMSITEVVDEGPLTLTHIFL